MTAQPLLIALVSVQFLVHALVWAMTARMARRWREAEGHFALFWFMLAAGLMLFVPPWDSGSAPRNLADLLIIAASAGESVWHWYVLVIRFSSTPSKRTMSWRECSETVTIWSA